MIGLLWLSTVPPTAGLVTLFFGARLLWACFMASPSSAIRSARSFGVWLGGYVFDQTGSYSLVWYLGILLGLASAAIHLPIKERSAPAFQPKPASISQASRQTKD